MVNVAALAAFGDGATVDKEALAGRGLINAKGGPVKLLGDGEAPKNLKVSLQAASASARQKIEAAGVRDAQQVLADGLSDEIIEWRSLEVFESLASSPNTKVIVTNGETPMLVAPDGN